MNKWDFSNKIVAIKALRELIASMVPETETKIVDGRRITTIAFGYLGLKDSKDFVEACMELGKKDASPINPTTLYRLTQVSFNNSAIQIVRKEIGFYLSYDAMVKARQEHIDSYENMSGYYRELWTAEHDYENDTIEVSTAK